MSIWIAAGPGLIPSRVPKKCADKLASIITSIFNQIFSQLHHSIRFKKGPLSSRSWSQAILLAWMTSDGQIINVTITSMIAVCHSGYPAVYMSMASELGRRGWERVSFPKPNRSWSPNVTLPWCEKVLLHFFFYFWHFVVLDWEIKNLNQNQQFVFLVVSVMLK